MLRLGDAVAITHGFAFPGAGFSNNPAFPTLFTPGNFRIGGGFQEARVKTFVGEIPDQFILRPNDLVVTMTDLSKKGDTLGYPAFVPSEGTYLHNQRIGKICIIDRSRIDTAYLALVLRSSAYRRHVLATATGSTVRHTSPSRILEFRMPVPRLEEQRRIAEVLGTLDDLIDTNQMTISSQTKLAAARFARQFGSLHGSGSTFAQLVTVTGGGTPKTTVPEYWRGSIPWFSVVDTPEAGQPWIFDSQKHVSELGLRNSSTRLLPERTVIISARGTVGNLALTAVPMTMNQSCYALNCALGGAGFFTYFAARAVVERLRQMSHGSVFSTVTRQTLERLEVSRVSAADVAQFDDAVGDLMESSRQLGIENSQLRMARDQLLPLLVSGRVRVRDLAGVV